MGKTWVQPTLGGASVKWFRLEMRFRWPIGWTGYLSVQMEDEVEPTTLVRVSECQTPELIDALHHCGDLLVALLGND